MLFVARCGQVPVRLDFIALQIHLATIKAGTSFATGFVNMLKGAIAGAIQKVAGGIAVVEGKQIEN